jgi:superfamily II DNA or RNA helicase
VPIDVKVYANNHVFVRFECDEGITQEISDYFTFYVPGYQYHPLFKKKLWDGQLRLANRRTHTLYRGLITHLQEFCKDRSYTLQIEDEILLTTELSLHEADQFIKTLNIPADRAVRDYQFNAFVQAIRNRRQLIVSPTASGKSLMLYYIVRYLLLTPASYGLLIVPTTGLVEQMYGDFKDYGWTDIGNFVHRIYSGKEKFTDHYLTITTWQSLHQMWKADPKYLEKFDFVIGDEAHGFKAKSLGDIMTGLTKAVYRIGCTGTLDGTKTNKLVLEGHFGPVLEAATTKDLMDRGFLAQLEIKVLVLKYPELVCQKTKKFDYTEEIHYIIRCDARNKFIRNLAFSLKTNTLILFALVEKHGKILHKMIRLDAAPGRKIFYVDKDTPVEEREAIRHEMEEATDAIIIASYGTFSTGINIKNLHNIIFAHPSKGTIRNRQSIGRGLRTADGKITATLFDIVDDLRTGKRTNKCIEHFQERMRIYQTQKFKVQTYKIDLKGAE